LVNHAVELNALLFTDDQVIIAGSDNDIQGGVFTIQNIENNIGI
jgi:hypothetical protein